MRHKGDPAPTTPRDWAGRGLFLGVVPLGFLATALLGHLVLAFVILAALGAYPQWVVWASRRALIRSVPRPDFADPPATPGPGERVGTASGLSGNVRSAASWPRLALAQIADKRP